MIIKKFRCKLCKNSDWTTRRALRKHVKDNHARNQLTNSGIGKDGLYIKQNWWEEKEFE